MKAGIYLTNTKAPHVPVILVEGRCIDEGVYFFADGSGSAATNAGCIGLRQPTEADYVCSIKELFEAVRLVRGERA